MALAKTRVAVLFGGRSAEHEVSLRSATNVIQHLDHERFDVIPIGIDKSGNWFMGKDVFAKSIEQNNVPMISDHNQAWFTPEWIGKDVVLKSTPAQNSMDHHFDVVFPAVHGTFCEDGTLQGLLELSGLPYVGCGVLSSAVGMDKDIAKKLVAHAGIAVAPYISCKHDQWLQHPKKILDSIDQKLSYPLFVKPANAGSSVGITKVKTPDQLSAAINEAFRFDTKILIENALQVLELEVAVLESLEPAKDPIVSVVGEIKPRHEFYSYDAKYLDADGAELIIPASVSEDVQAQAKIIATKAFEALECEGMARVDLFYDLNSKQIVFNEINTLPGFTQISMYPKLMAASGISYKDLLSHLVALALKRHKNKGLLVRSYA